MELEQFQTGQFQMKSSGTMGRQSTIVLSITFSPALLLAPEEENGMLTTSTFKVNDHDRWRLQQSDNIVYCQMLALKTPCYPEEGERELDH